MRCLCVVVVVVVGSVVASIVVAIARGFSAEEVGNESGAGCEVCKSILAVRR